MLKNTFYFRHSSSHSIHFLMMICSITWNRSAEGLLSPGPTPSSFTRMYQAAFLSNLRDGFTVHYPINPVQCTVFFSQLKKKKHGSICIVQCTLYTVLYNVHSVQCTLYTVHMMDSSISLSQCVLASRVSLLGRRGDRRDSWHCGFVLTMCAVCCQLNVVWSK